MTNSPTIIRSLIIYGLCLPLAVWLGYLLAMPMDMTSFIMVILALCLPLVPVMLRWHHFLLIACWNVSAVLFFLPGRPFLWIVMSLISLTLSILQYALHRDYKLLSVPSVTFPLIFLFLVILATGKLTGGLGFRSFGSESFGGKRYVFLLTAILGYFAISCQRIPRGREGLYVSLNLLGGVFGIIGGLVGFLPSRLNYIFLFFPPESLQAISGRATQDYAEHRFGALSVTGGAVVWYCLARHGLGGTFRLSESWHILPFRIRGGFQINQPWRAGLTLVAMLATLYSGFRWMAIFTAMMFLGCFFMERLYRSRALPFVLLAVILSVTISLPLASKLPAMVQRSLSFLPLNIDPDVRMFAESSTEWRLRMWEVVIPTVPQFLLVGKGYSIDPVELEMASSHMSRDDTETMIVAGDYHNGALTLIIPLGIWGVIGFLWFLGAGFRVLRRNYRHGDPELRRINTFLLLYFLAKTFCFFLIAGTFYVEFYIFTGLVALSISVNGGVRGPVPVVAAKPTFHRLQLARLGR